MDDTEALLNALAFAELGHAVLPLYTVTKGPDGFACACGGPECGSAGKHPHARLAPHGLKDASTDSAIIRAWAENVPELNFGVVTDSLLVLDVDGDAGRVSLAALERKHGPLPPTWRVSTGGRNGRHCFFRPPPGADIRNSASRIAKGLDVRARGGYVCVAGCLHISGRRYTWWLDHHPNDCEMAPAPAWLLGAVLEPKRNGARPVAEWRALAASRLQEGSRNENLARLAGHLLSNCIDPGVACELLQGFNQGRCVPPLPAAEVEAVVTSIALAELRKRTGGHG